MITLYKKDSSNRVRVLKVYTEGADLIYLTGIHDGKLVEARKTCKGKNIGRANETTPEQQATQEMQSKIETERSTGYFDTYEEALSSSVVLPQLAKEYGKEKHKINWAAGVIVQRKLDGMRCMAQMVDGKIQLMSRKGKVIDTLPHIQELLSWLPDGITLDGELYLHGESFQANMSLIKKNQPGSEKVMYVVYDQVSDRPYKDRLEHVQHLLHPFYGEKVVALDADTVYSEEEMKALHAKFLSEGYEGTMVKHGPDGYKIDARSSSMLKYKDWQDIALPIKDIRPSEQRPEWGQAWFHWPGAKNDEISAGWKFDHAFREELLKNKEQYIGQTAEIRYFEKSETGVLRMPVMYGIRLDK